MLSDSEIETSEEEIKMLVTSPVNSPRRTRGVVALVGISVVSMVFASLAIAKTWARPASAPQSKSVEQLFDADISRNDDSSATEFMTSRRLAQSVALNFDVKCMNDQPICNPEIVFASEIQNFLNNMKKVSPEVHEILAKGKLSKTQQELIMKVLPLAHNVKILELGAIIGETVKRWEKSGSRVVNEKVKEAMDHYLEDHGSSGIPKIASSQPNTGNASMWLSRLEPELISVVRKDDGKSAEFEHVLSQQDGGHLSARRMNSDQIILGLVIAGSIVTGLVLILGLIYFIFEVLNYTGQFELPLAFKKVTFWINGVLGTIECLGIVNCPFVFLSYWLDAWLLFGHKPSELKGLPWDFLLKHLPGLNHANEPGWRRLLAVDSHISS